MKLNLSIKSILLGIFVIYFLTGCYFKNTKKNTQPKKYPHFSYNHTHNEPYQEPAPIETLTINLGSELEPGEYGDDSRNGEASPEFLFLRYDSPIFQSENTLCQNYLRQFNGDFLSTCYCNNTDSVLQPLYKWLSEYNPLDADLELDHMRDIGGAKFYTISKKLLADSLIKSYTSYPFYVDIKDPAQIISQFSEYYLNETKRYDDNLIKKHTLVEQIWDEKYLGLDIYNLEAPIQNMKYSEKKLYQTFYHELLEKQKHDSISITYSEIIHLQNSISKCTNDWNKIQAYFMLSSLIIRTNLHDSAYAPLREIRTILNIENHLTELEKAQSFLGVAKFLVTIDFKKNSKDIYSYLKVATSIVYKKPSNKLYENKLTFIRALFWLNMNHSTATNFAIKGLGILYRETSKNDYATKIKIISRLAIALCQLHSNYTREIRGYIPSDILLLRMASYISILNLGLYYGVLPEYTHNGMKALAYYYTITHKPFNALACEYSHLKYLLYFPKKEYFDIVNSVNNIIEYNKEVAYDSIAIKWVKSFYVEPTDEIDSFYYSQHELPTDVRLWSSEKYNSVIYDCLTTPVSDYYYNYDPLKIKNAMNMIAAHVARTGDFETAYRLIEKSDSIQWAEDITLMFDLGYTGAASDDYVELQKLTSEKKLLSIEVKELNNSLNNKARILTKLDSQIHAKEKVNDHLANTNKELLKNNNSLTNDNKALGEKNTEIVQTLTSRNFIIITLSVLFLIITYISIRFFQQRRLAVRLRDIANEERRKAIIEMRRAEVSEAKERVLARTMSQLGHLTPDIQWLLADKLKSDNAAIASQLGIVGNKLREIYLTSSKTQTANIFENELNLSLELMSIRYQDNHRKPSILTKIYNEQLLSVSMPPLIIFNLVANAYKHGQITQRDENELYGSLEINSTFKNNYWNITFENDCPPPYQGKAEKGTGLEFVKLILKEWNGEKISPNFESMWYKTPDNTWKYKVSFNLKNETIHSPVDRRSAQPV